MTLQTIARLYGMGWRLEHDPALNGWGWRKYANRAILASATSRDPVWDEDLRRAQAARCLDDRQETFMRRLGWWVSEVTGAYTKPAYDEDCRHVTLLEDGPEWQADLAKAPHYRPVTEDQPIDGFLIAVDDEWQWHVLQLPDNLDPNHFPFGTGPHEHGIEGDQLAPGLYRCACRFWSKYYHGDGEWDTGWTVVTAEPVGGVSDVHRGTAASE